MSKSSYVGVIVADLHCGAFDANIWYEELNNGLIKNLKKMPILDFLIIAGDFYHSKISVNSKHAKVGLKIFTKIVKICKEKNAKLRIIKGTESHDNKQLEMLESLEELSDCDIKFIYTVEKEWLFSDLKILYLPEEYINDMNEYYQEFFNEHYNYIVGHGLVDKAAFIASIQESETTHPKAPIFKVKQLESICYGPIYFGHVHKHMRIGNFRYVSSYSRWSFGEEEDKGYYITYFSPGTGNFKDEFIKNKYARNFDTVKIEITSSIFNKSENEIIKYLMDIINNLTMDYLRLEINIPEDYPNPLLLTQLIKETFVEYKNIKFKIINNTKEKQKKIVEEQVNLLLEKYGFIFDKSIEPERKLSEFIKIKYNRYISIDKIREYLTEEIDSKGE